MLAWMPNHYIQRSGWNCGIVLAEIKRIYTAPYCAIVTWYCSGDRTPSHSYGLVTGTFPEHSCNPIYMHLCHIFFVSIYFRNLPNTLELQSGGPLVSRELEVQYVLSWPSPFDCRKCTILQPNYCLFVASMCMPISCSKLEMQYVLLWPAHLYHTRVHI